VKRPQRKPAGRGLRIEELFADLRGIRRQDDNWDESEPTSGLEDNSDVGEELEQPSRRIESWDQSQAASVGNPRCPHPGCREPITFAQNAAGRQVTCCGAHGVVQPAQVKVRPDNGRHWGDNYSMSPWQPVEWREPTRRSAPAMDTYGGIRVVRARKPAPRPRYEPPIDPLDFGNG
jgi:hypothetical protein